MPTKTNPNPHTNDNINTKSILKKHHSHHSTWKKFQIPYRTDILPPTPMTDTRRILIHHHLNNNYNHDNGTPHDHNLLQTPTYNGKPTVPENPNNYENPNNVKDLNLSSLKQLSDNENRNTSLPKQLTDPQSDTQDNNTTTNTTTIADTPILILPDKNYKDNLTQHLIFNPYAKTNNPDHQKTNQNTSNHYKSITPNREPHENTFNPTKHFLDMKISSHKNQTLQNNQQLQTSNTPIKKNPYILPDLECLQPVIMSQHSALTKDILELGQIYLNFTNIIQKKKESSNKIVNDHHIPRSLRIKCELITSPSYENTSIYQELKQELQECVNRFTTESLTIMKTWYVANIQLLNKDRCESFLKKAIHILDGLISYWTDLLQPLPWPPIMDNPLLLILKIYFNKEYTPDITKIEKYLEYPSTEILLTAVNIFTKYNNTTINMNIINDIDLHQLENLKQNHITVIMETLSSFDSILRATTITLWDSYSLKIRQTEASIKFKAKMDASRTQSATAATAKSIEKAVQSISSDNTCNQITQLRISNIEKQLTQQKQTANEILNHLKTQQQQQQKIGNGSHSGQVPS
jgi:hypothetical protein